MRLPIRIGSRGSKLALIQVELAKAALIAAMPELADDKAIEVEIFKTSGDAIQDRSLASAGGKGLFTKEIEEAMLAGRIDLAVHSLKDVPTILPEVLAIAATLPRAEIEDAFISLRHRRFADLPQGALIGTASIRRTAQIMALRPDLKTGLMRGNVDTRLKKLDDGQADATILAYAGLKRLGLTDRISEILPIEQFLPAATQGIIGLEIRQDNAALADLLARAGCPKSFIQATAERALLRALDGSCRTPIGAYARFDTDGKHLQLDGFVATPEGTHPAQGTKTGLVADAEKLGIELGRELRAIMPAGYNAP